MIKYLVLTSLDNVDFSPLRENYGGILSCSPASGFTRDLPGLVRVEGFLVSSLIIGLLGDSRRSALHDLIRREEWLRVTLSCIGDAVKYSPQGGLITVTLESCNHDACLSVADCGIGIPVDSIPRLFERFYRAPNSEAQHIAGLGIGLFVTKEIVSLHGGSVHVESTEGSGTIFTVHLPLGIRANRSADSGPAPIG